MLIIPKFNFKNVICNSKIWSRIKIGIEIEFLIKKMNRVIKKIFLYYLNFFRFLQE